MGGGGGTPSSVEWSQNMYIKYLDSVMSLRGGNISLGTTHLKYNDTNPYLWSDVHNSLLHLQFRLILYCYEHDLQNMFLVNILVWEGYWTTTCVLRSLLSLHPSYLSLRYDGRRLKAHVH